MVTDYDSWREGDEVSADAILAVMQANAAKARAAIGGLAVALPRQRAPSPIDTALEGAIVTPRAQWDPLLRVRLDAVARRILRKTPGG
jgi:5'-methylthioadenosine phosphorylase